MNINEIYKLVEYVANKEQRGDVPPEKFNILAPAAQNEVISEYIGPPESPVGGPKYGYKHNRRISEAIRPLVTPLEEIVLDTQGNFEYPYGFIWPDSVQKTDFNPIKEIESDEYPFIKRSHLIPPTVDYPVLIWRNPYGFIDPYNIGSFLMSYVKRPPAPYWAYDVVNDAPVYNAGNSVQFALQDEFSSIRIAMKILSYIGINLDAAQVTQFAELKQAKGT